MVRDNVYLKVSPIKGAIRFGSTWKLKPKYIRHFDIIAKVGDLAYELALPLNLNGVHIVFYVSMLKKYIKDKNHIILNYI